MDPEDADMIVSIVGKILVRYLVYRSVVLSVKTAVARVRETRAAEFKGSSAKQDGGKADWGLKSLKERHDTEDELQMKKWTPEARRAWRRFEHLAIERYLVTIHMKVVKKKAVTCDNVKCQKVDEKNNFMRCSSCSNTMYCSRECQITAWKEGGHKLVCKLKQKEMQEGRFQSISEGDAAFFHHLATRDARHHLPLLLRLASASYPQLSLTDLIISIDYMKHPPKFTVYPLSEHEKHCPRIASDTSANAEARNEELINRARQNPGKYGIIQSRIANGQGMQMVLSVVTGTFWNEREPREDQVPEGEWNSENEGNLKGAGKRRKGRRAESDDSHDEDDIRGTNVDGVDMMMARMTLNGLLKAMGEPERF
ncbi:hypothetical protein NLJ89_g2432 [Agrocybe chaxingu]|uniref:MYND-type domain-containing protein n=1 Tax=Agrocybe chaxingu TaxID=84603 RepID=A0A9W8MYW1_9AGAR|nr:hypothetical protein NLJ89_g2432 [Agrocybe chaxingu]